MAITLTCACGKVLQIGDEFAGQQGRCPFCGVVVNIAAVPALPLTDLRLPAAPLPAYPSTEPASPFGGLAAAPDEESRPYYPLFSPRQVALAGLLGGFLGGCLVLAGNFTRLKRPSAALLTRILGFALTAATFLAVYWYADVPGRLRAFLYLGPIFLAEQVVAGLVLFGLAQLVQGRLHADHVARAGRTASLSSAAALCLTCTAVFFFVQVLGTYPLTWDGGGGVLEYGDRERIIYREGIDRQQAERCGRVLREIANFNGFDGGDVVLSREAAGYSVTVFLKDLAWNDPDVLAYYQELRQILSDRVFEGQPVQIRLCDVFNRLKKTIP